jgi:subtilisin family serine protease
MCVPFFACDSNFPPASPTSPSQVTTSYDGVASSFDRIGVRPVHAQGLTGQGVTVAIIDDGIDFRDPALQGKEVPGGATRVAIVNDTDPSGLSGTLAFYNGVTVRIDPTPEYDVPLYLSGGHGTVMAKILAGSLNISNNLGMAPEAHLIPYSMSYAGYGVKLVHALSLGAKIASMSICPVWMRQFCWCSSSIPVLQNILIVVIAGNHDDAHPNAASAMGSGHIAPFDTEYGNVIVTVAVDESNHLTSVSNRCGHTQRFCIAVPAAGPTSPTAPIVSGAAALLMEAVPGRPIRDYANAILETATPLGSPEETGRGLLNVDSALRYLRAH